MKNLAENKVGKDQGTNQETTEKGKEAIGLIGKQAKETGRILKTKKELKISLDNNKGKKSKRKNRIKISF